MSEKEIENRLENVEGDLDKVMLENRSIEQRVTKLEKEVESKNG